PGGWGAVARLAAWGTLTDEGGWGPTEAHPPVQRATSRVVGVAYPFLAGAGMGPYGVAIGHLTDGGGLFCFDPWECYQRGFVTGTSMLILGDIGSGKSTTAKAFASREIGLGRRVFVASDPKNEWVPLARQIGGQVIEIGPGLPARLNPLDPPPRDPKLDDEQWAAEVLSRRRLLLINVFTVVLKRSLTPAEYTAVDVFLEAATAAVQGRTLTLTDIWMQLNEPTTEAGRASLPDAGDLTHALRRVVVSDLSGMFDGPSTVELSQDAPMVVVATGAFERAAEEARNLAMLLSSEWLEGAIMIKTGGQRIVIYDEGYRMLRNEHQLQRMSDRWKLARHYGLTNVLIMHRVSDLDAIGEQGSSARNLALGLLGDTQIRIIGAQRPDQIDMVRKTLATSDTVTQIISHLAQGNFVWQIKDKTFLVHTDVTTYERDVLFDTNARMGTSEHDAAEGPAEAPILEPLTADAADLVSTEPVASSASGSEPRVDPALAALVASTPDRSSEPSSESDAVPAAVQPALPSLADLPPMPAPPAQEKIPPMPDPPAPTSQPSAAPVTASTMRVPSVEEPASEPSPRSRRRRKRLVLSKPMVWGLAGAIAATGVLAGGGAMVSSALNQPHPSPTATRTVADWTRINGTATSIPGAAGKPAWTVNVPDGGVASVSDAAVMLVVPGSPTAQVQLLNPDTGQQVWSGPSTGTIPWAVSTNVGDALAEVWLDGTTLSSVVPSTGQVVTAPVSPAAKFSEFGESLMVTDGDQVSTLTRTGLSPVTVPQGLTPVAVDGTTLLSVDSAGDVVSSDLAGNVKHRGVAKAPGTGLVFKGWITAGHGRAATVWTPSSPDGTATIGYQTVGGKLTGRVKVSTTRIQQAELTRGVGGRLSSYAGVVFDTTTGQVRDLAQAGFTISTMTGGWVNGNLKSTRVATDFARTVRSLQQPAAVTGTTVIVRSGPQISGFALAKEKK
ncbi:MAG: hypothetical protein ABF811_06210, partial [Pseudoclavibacter sp.]